MARLIYILAFALAFLPIDAQQREQTLAGETLFIASNTNSLLAGETLYFKLSCLNPNGNAPGTVSKIAYVELIDSDRKTVVRQKIAIENTVGAGDFFIPTTWPSGNYKLIGYTKWMLDLSLQHYFALDLTIVNPFQKFEGEIAAIPRQEIPVGTSIFAATSDKKSYAVREKVTLKINPAAGIKGHYSLSVKKVNGFNRPSRRTIDFTADFKNSATDALPELRGEIISGRIASEKNSKSLGSRNVALSLPGKSFSFKIVQTDRNGRFIFVLDKASNHSQAVIQVMETDRKDYSIVLDQHKRPDYSQLAFGKFQLDEPAKDAIATRAIALQIENAYFNHKKDSIVAMPESQPFFHPLEKVYVLDDFTRFPTLRETIIEVVTEMYATKKRDQYEIHLRNATMNNEQYGQPLILVDGLLIQDHDELFSYGAKYIEKVSLINEPYVYGPKTFSGVANFTTKLEDFRSNASGTFIEKTTLERPMPNKNYFAPDYSKGQSRIPDYRHQLLWMPEISGESQDISFYTSDVTGLFEVEIQGFSATGTPVFLTFNFEVR